MANTGILCGSLFLFVFMCLIVWIGARIHETNKKAKESSEAADNLRTSRDPRRPLKERMEAALEVKKYQDRLLEIQTNNRKEETDYEEWRERIEKKQGYRFHADWLARAAFKQDRNQDFRTGKPLWKE